MSDYTSGQLASLKAAVASGVRTVSHNGSTVTYASTDEMLRLIAKIERDLGVGANAGRSAARYPGYRKGV